MFWISSALLGFTPTPITGRCSSLQALGTTFVPIVGFRIQRTIPDHPRCRVVAVEDEKVDSSSFPGTLDMKQIESIFKDFDTSGDGFIQLDELQAALSKAGKPVSLEAAQDILKRVLTLKPTHRPVLVHRSFIAHRSIISLVQVDANNDGQISLEEFKAVFQVRATSPPPLLISPALLLSRARSPSLLFSSSHLLLFQLAPDAVPEGLKPLTGVAGFFLRQGDLVANALGIEVRGQWRTTAYGSRYVDDVVGNGKPDGIKSLI